MGGIAEGLGFLVRLILLLFCWGLIAVLVSPELGAFIGVLLLGAWVAVYVPWAIIRAKRNAPPPLPPLGQYTPQGSSAPTTGGDLMLIDAPDGGASLPDILRALPPGMDLPPHPMFEPLPEKPFFRRTLVLPVAAVLMLAGILQGDLINSAVTALGVGPKIDATKLVAPANEKENIMAAARVMLRRESGCAQLLSGKLAPKDQLKGNPGDAFVYEFRCTQPKKDSSTYNVWVEPAEVTPLPWPALANLFAAAPDKKKVEAECMKSAMYLLAGGGVQLNAGSSPVISIYKANLPYRAYVRAVMVLETARPGDTYSRLTASCWLEPNGAATVRFGGQ